MLPYDVEEKIGYFDSDKYKVSNSEVVLKEKQKAGQVVLKCILKNETIIFPSPDKVVMPYLDNVKKGARACPDSFLFELMQDGTWILHIMEYKKSISTDSIDKSKIQFTMGIYNARAIAGFLNIKIKKIYVYSAYRKDTIGTPQALIMLRSANLSQKDRAIVNDWKKERCTLKVDMEEKQFRHVKIQLDENGNGTCELENVDSI